MRGTIVAFDADTGTGEAVDADGQSYFFTAAHWLGPGTPIAGAAVEIVGAGAELRMMPLRSRPPFTWPWFLFSIRGRVTRREYWLKYALPWVGLFLLVVSVGSLTADSTGHNAWAGWVLILVLVVSTWTGIAVQVKRLHDRGLSGWFSLVGFIPILGEYWLAAQVGFMRGERGANRFGPDPLA
ncbi:hypothetical protein AZA_88153 [Nitrospirillum viridazoti Y2]|uniref:Uncharacterized membrane protein YhaH (DUF805 family) n=1 Tax=Nitrospirillum amazonense TaxID=28077 RepID=A0A560HSE0_9PROT|nr:DUF805 domain-containing protein [Nitrospirillum amazonense]EGY02090.1 hypothetical protein AZA_88153 [Nitrospirillum amazonense Y2]TWB49507.1 uncharacterized membrane protein YhaH (DUF805 family) [Nitrospirillum amazonense]